MKLISNNQIELSERNIRDLYEAFVSGERNPVLYKRGIDGLVIAVSVRADADHYDEGKLHV